MNILRFWTVVQYMCEKPLSLTMCSFTKRNILTHWTCRLMNKNTMGGGRLRIVSTQVPIISGWICPPTISCRPTGAREGTRSSKSRMTRFRSKGAAQGSDHCDMMCSNIWVWYLWMLLNVYIMNNYVRFSFWHLSLDSFQSLRSASFPPSVAAKLLSPSTFHVYYSGFVYV